MKNLLIALVSTGLLAGCVTQSTYSGTNKPVVRSETDRTEAATKRLELGLAYLKAGDPVQAKFNLEKARDFAPSMPQVHSSLAYFYQQVGEFAQAKAAYQYAIRLNPQDAAILNNYGVFLCAQQDYIEADKYFLSAIAIPSYTRVADAYENAGVCALEGEEKAKAKGYFERALSYNALRPRSLLRLAELEFEQEDFLATSTYLQRFHINRQPTATSSALAYRLAKAQSDIRQLVKYADILKTRFPDTYELLQQSADAADSSQPAKKRIKRIKKPKAESGSIVSSKPTSLIEQADSKAQPGLVPPLAQGTQEDAQQAQTPATTQTAINTEADALQQHAVKPVVPRQGDKAALQLPLGDQFGEENWLQQQLLLRMETQLQLNHSSAEESEN